MAQLKVVAPQGSPEIELAEKDFFLQYLDYTAGTEVPTTFNRWSIMTGLGAYVGKTVYVKLGDEKIYPNLYCLLLGSPGTRKSTAIKDMKRFLAAAGYDKFAYSKTSNEQFIADLAEGFSASTTGFDLDASLFSSLGGESDFVSEVFVSPDEFTEFFGNNILAFVSTLGDLWNVEGTYTVRTKHSGSSTISNPYVSLIGGTTPVTLNEVFPPAVIGQGFFSRLLFIHGVPNGRRIAFPKGRDPEITERLVGALRELRAVIQGELSISREAKDLIEFIYQVKVHPVNDGRFEYYAGRRQTQLIKLAILSTIASGADKLEEYHVRRANTVLTVAEHFMPKALGEFGRARTSEIQHKLLTWLEAVHEPVPIHTIWKALGTDIDRVGDLQGMLNSLIATEKIRLVGEGFLPVKEPLEEVDSPMYDWSYITDEEKGYK